MSAGREASKEETARSEDYLEAVYNLVRERGYATTSDISSRLDVKPPTVSDMVSKLTAKGFLRHERYRGMTLTKEGEKLAKSVIKRHSVIAEFLAMLGVDDAVAYEDTEGIEHHVHQATLRRIEKTASYLRKNPKALKALRGYIESE
ncbi:MAG: transcriptional regulator MntR [Nitrososphaerales archaeon]|nr:transcriptional regulator MntR [Nitrososphaerales archaeon]